ncbi:hypothetical protein CMI40_00110 [Candidatus Pacearchaeota archaeon]|jgi:hypothetical protein|nr:hypothetical protein [Candidatus Pacearchaeota archaeon]|tara:strand:- start:7684 stop:8154 length:471 start_codon:yes stop_codon:yes gene_type:complete
MKNTILKIFLTGYLTLIGVNSYASESENKLESFPQGIKYIQQNKNIRTKKNGPSSIRNKTLISVMGDDCRLIKELSFYNNVGLKQRLFYSKSKNHFVSTLTRKRNLYEWRKHPLFYLINYNPNINKAQETWKDLEEDGPNGNEELHWIKNTKIISN